MTEGITPAQLGTVLLAMAEAVRPDKYPTDSREWAMANVLAWACLAGAKECQAIIARDGVKTQDADAYTGRIYTPNELGLRDHKQYGGEWTPAPFGKFIDFAPGSYVEIMMHSGNSYVYPHEIVGWDSADIKAWRVVPAPAPVVGAAPMVTPTPVAPPMEGQPGWIEYDGDTLPSLANDVQVEVQFRSGRTNIARWNLFRWSSLSIKSDIVRYRVIDKSEQTG